MTENREYRFGKFHLNSSDNKLSDDNGVIRRLSNKESKLLIILCKNINNVVERRVALMQVWGDDDYYKGRSMDVYIARLRKLLKEDPSVEIINLHGQGFKLIAK